MRRVLRGAVGVLIGLGTLVAIGPPARATPGDIDAQPISGVNELVLGSDGLLYASATLPPSIIQLDPDTGAVTETFAVPAGEPDELAADDQGSLWFSVIGDAVLRRLDPSGGAITAEADLATTRVDDLVVGPDGRVWFTSYGSSDPVLGAVSGGTVERFTNVLIGDGRITVGPDDQLWMTNCTASSLVEIDPVGEVFTAHSVDDDAFCPQAITVGPDDDLWFTFHDGVGRFDPDDGSVAVAHGRTRDRYDDITAGADGQVWALNNVWIVRVDPATMDLDRYVLPQPAGGGDDLARGSTLVTDAEGGIWGVYYGQLLDVELGAPDATDSTDPTASIVTPAAGADYRDDDLVLADFSCADGDSRVVQCVGGSEPPHFSIPRFGNVFPNPGYGPDEFTVYARDAAGNTAEPTVAFRRTKTCFDRRVTILRPFGGSGSQRNDVIFGAGSRDDPINARGGNDRVCARGWIAGGAGDDEVEGGHLTDVLWGGPGRDRLAGGRGNDVIIGGPGIDVCEGGAGRDTFRGCEKVFQE
jgi:streptogramin lyase